MRRSSATVLGRARPWILGLAALHGSVALAGRLAAWRKNEGDETSTSVRRVLTHTGLELRPTNAELSRVRIDMAMAGAEIDLTGIPRPAHGLDITLRVLMGGAAVRVPADWRVWWRFRGVGGMGGDGVVARVHDERTADVRIHAVVVFGGVGIEGG